MPKRDPRLLTFAKQMRSEPTPAEARLWSALRAGRLDGVKFVHQAIAAGAIPDFVARRHKLIVEVDGETHDFTVGSDASRTARLLAQGYRILRVTNDDVMKNLDGVLAMIRQALQKSGSKVEQSSSLSKSIVQRHCPSPWPLRGRPSPQRGEG